METSATTAVVSTEQTVPAVEPAAAMDVAAPSAGVSASLSDKLKGKKSKADKPKQKKSSWLSPGSKRADEGKDTASSTAATVLPVAAVTAAAATVGAAAEANTHQRPLSRPVVQFVTCPNTETREYQLE